MKIVFVLPCISLSGGVKVVFEYANHLKERGHEVIIVYPIIPMNQGYKWYDLKKWLLRLIGSLRNIKRGIKVNWFHLNVPLLMVPTLNENYIPEADVIIATGWKTAEYVAGYTKNKGEKFYLVQSYETWDGPKEQVEKTYKSCLHNIVVSTWLKNELENLGAKIDGLILNSIDFSEFYKENKRENKSKEVRILIPYRIGQWKGAEDGIKAFEIVKRNCENVKLVLFGSKPNKKHLPPNTEFHVWPIKDELRSIYNSCEIFCFPSRLEGFGLPPMEAMACGCAVVSTDVGAIRDYAINNVTVLISTPGKVAELAELVCQLIKDENRRKKIADAGYEHIKQFSWRKSTDELENILKKYANNTEK